jgi:hypothetical protein
VESLIGRIRGLDATGISGLASLGVHARLGDEPWPPGTSPDDDEALRVSSALAGRDAAAAVPATQLDPRVVSRARRAAERIAHLLVLRHAFAPSTFETLTAPWRPRLLPDDPPAPSVRRPRHV